MTFAVTIDRRWGGFYAAHCYSWRLCVGYIAIDVFPESVELIFRQLTNTIDVLRRAADAPPPHD